MPQYVIDTLKPKNNNNFPVAEAVDVLYEEGSTVKDKIIAINALIVAAQQLIEGVQTDISELQSGKVDKVSGKGLSTNDFTNTYKSKVDNTYTKTETDTALAGKVDKVSGKGLSTNDFTNTYKNKVDNTYTKTETDSAIAGKIAEVVAEAPESFDTLKEIADWIDTHADSASAMNSAIQANATNIAKKVDKVTGKGLSTNDFTTAYKNKIDNTYTKSETDSAIAGKIAEVVAEAPESFDTLKEIADWIDTHADSASAMNSAIQANATNIAKKVDKVTGKGLSTNDFTTAYKDKIDDTYTKSESDSITSAISARVAENESDISQLQTDVSSKASISALTETNNTVAANKANLQSQIDTLVVESVGDSNAEVVQARVGVDGTVYDTLKTRLDASDINLQNLLKTSVRNKYIFENAILDKNRKTGSATDARITYDAPGWFTSELMEVEPDTNYILLVYNENIIKSYSVGELSGAYVDENYAPIKSFSTNTTSEITSAGTSPSNAKYLFVQGSSGTKIDGVSAYTRLVVVKDAEMHDIPSLLIRNIEKTNTISVKNKENIESIKKELKSITSEFKNLYDISGTFLNKSRNTGSATNANNLVSHEGWFTSNLIEVEPGNKYAVYICNDTDAFPYTLSQLSGAYVDEEYHPIAGSAYTLLTGGSKMIIPQSPENAKYLFIQGSMTQNVIGTDILAYTRLMVIKEGITPRRYFDFDAPIYSGNNINVNYQKIAKELNGTVEDGWYVPVDEKCRLINAVMTDDGFFKTITPDGNGTARIYIPVNGMIPGEVIKTVTLIINHDLESDNAQFAPSGTRASKLDVPAYDYRTSTMTAPYGITYHTVGKEYLGTERCTTLAITLTGGTNSHLKINGILINHRVEPTILLNFDQIWQETIDNGGYQFLYDNQIPFTLFTGYPQSNFEEEITKMLRYGNELSLYGGIVNASDYNTLDAEIKETIVGAYSVAGVTTDSWGSRQHNSNFMQLALLERNGVKLVRNKTSSNFINNINNKTKVINTFDVGEYSIGQLKSIVDKVCDYGVIASIFTHGICADENTKMTKDGQLTNSTGVKLTVFKEFINYCIEKGIKFRTFKSYCDNERI